MLRTLLYFVLVGLLVFVAYMLAEQPGEVTLVWLGQRIDTDVGTLIFATFLFGVAVALVLFLWRFFTRAPGELGRLFSRGRQRRGYRALSQGMVAVAAGDAEEAKRWARKADSLLNDPPLTMLLSAQAAQLEGDEQAAKRYFEAMLEIEDLRFLGLRGLLMQALRQGDDEAALRYARKAQQMRPNSAWVLETLFDLSEKAGDLEGAERAIKDAVKAKALPAGDSTRKRAVLLVEQAIKARAEGQREAPVKLLKEARKLAPGMVAASVQLAEVYAELGRLRDAARLLERAWAMSPHPALVAAYRLAKPIDDPIAAFKNVAKLTGAKAEHPESLIALAEAALDAKLWGEARRYLAKLIDGAEAEGPGERVCRLMARLEEAEHEDSAKAREWLLRAADAPPEPAWVCDHCGALAEGWTARCGACNSFDSLAWTRPPRVSAPLLAGEGGGALVEVVAGEGPPAEGGPPTPQAAEAGGRAAG